MTRLLQPGVTADRLPDDPALRLSDSRAIRAINGAERIFTARVRSVVRVTVVVATLAILLILFVAIAAAVWAVFFATAAVSLMTAFVASRSILRPFLGSPAAGRILTRGERGWLRDRRRL